MTSPTENATTPAHVRTRDLAEAAIDRYLRATTSGANWQEAFAAAHDGSTTAARAVESFAWSASGWMTTRQARADTVASLVAETALDEFQHLRETGMSEADAAAAAAGDSPVARHAVAGFLDRVNGGAPVEIALADAEHAAVEATAEVFASVDPEALRAAIDLVVGDTRDGSDDIDLTDENAIEQVRTGVTRDDVDATVTDAATLAAYYTVLDADPSEIEDALLQAEADRAAVPERAPEPGGWIDRHLTPQQPVVDADRGRPAAADAEQRYARMRALQEQHWTDDADVTDADADADTDGAEQTAVDSAGGAVMAEVDAVLDRIDAVLAEPELPPWDEQVARCGESVRAAADAVHRVEVADEDTERAERYAAWNAEDQTATDTAGADLDWGRR